MDGNLKTQLLKLKAALEEANLPHVLEGWEEKVWEPADKITSAKKLAELLERFSDTNIPKIIEQEKDAVLVDDALPRFNYDEILIDWLKQVPFFLEMSRWIRKRPGEYLPGGQPLPTAAMCYNLESDDFEMIYNKRWFTWLKVKFQNSGVKQIEGVTNHELYHMVWKHVTTRRRDPHYAWNIATDAAINSIITSNGGQLPKGGVIPGVKWDVPEGRKMTPEEKKMHEGLAKLIEGWPKLQASDWYFENLMSWSKDNDYKWGKNGIRAKLTKEQIEQMMKDLENAGKDPGDGPQMPGDGNGEAEGDGEGGQGQGQGNPGDGYGKEHGVGGIDVHDMWDDIPEEQRQLIEAKLKNIVKKAVKHADNTQNGWGNMPSEVRDQIRASVDDQIDWEAVLKNFIGMFNKGTRATSIKKINKRYAYIHPGVKKGYVPKLAICMDQSGSVSSTAVEQFFGVLGALSKKASFTLIPFDHSVDTDNVKEWKKGQRIDLKRTRQGGTSFDAPTAYVNASENRGKWDGVIFLTDGECSEPQHSRIRRGWVICPGHKLMFQPKGEMVITMEEPGKKATKNDGVVR